jgi:DNA helicase-2/ATP-dependent DNA helicase PcrA
MAEFRPTQEQQRILDHEVTRHARVLAGPGTGKSATIVALIEGVLSRQPPPRLRLLTFTRAATGELAKKASEHPAAAAERPSTVHSFAISLLVRNPGAANLPAPLRIADPWEYDRIVRPTLAQRVGIRVKDLEKLVREMSANWESLEEHQDPNISPELRARFMGAWNEHRRIYGYTLLQELPYGLRNALRDHADLEGVDYRLMVVDEYQDLNACDLDVIKRIADRGCTVIAAGDDDQSIYGFRKAAPEGIRRFVDEYARAADYTLSITQRCGARIIDWVNYVIEGDPDRPPKPRLAPAEGSPAGDVALLAFDTNEAEAQGIAALVDKLVNVEGLAPREILILLRSDHNGSFSNPIKQRLEGLRIPYTDPDAIDAILEDPGNRRLIACFRLLVNGDDSLAWATLLELEPGVGNRFVETIYTRVREANIQFGPALLAAYAEDFPNAPRAGANRVKARVRSVLEWIDATAELPDDETAWGEWIVSRAGNGPVPPPSNEMRDLLVALDGFAETYEGLGRFLGQIVPLGKDLQANTSAGVRIMTMTGAKGLTVEATIIGGLEEGLIPRPNANAQEERRLLYVAMTRAKKFLFGTWARSRTGPTARAGNPRVQERRTHSHFLEGGPVATEDGYRYIARKWPQR